MTTDQARWQRLSQLFDCAIDLDVDARAALLNAECADDPALRVDLQRLLDADATASEIDGGVPGMVDLSVRFDHDEQERPDDNQVGPWQLQSMLGQGGMGSVYAAVREDDSSHRAAVKRLHRRWDGSAQAQRFLQERRILASLSHRNLPRLIDHGLDRESRPWFALEYIDGQTLIDWADNRRLDLRARLQLFRQVCAAVQHAHEHFVVHRDLKPANILVDAQGHPKVLDFGVAKRLNESPSNTRTGAFAGFTPDYAAPEQISGGIISAATDVYALGVVLYQLLTGQLPYRIEHDNLRDVAEAVTSRTAERMDRALATGEPADVADRVVHRNTSVAAFRRFVRGDLTRIVQTALAKEPERRYASVQAFSGDLARFLEGRTVSVGGDTVGYRARKFVLRNRWAVAISCLALLAVIAALGAALWQAGVAQEHARTTAKVKDFVTGLLSAASPEVSLGKPLTVREVLDRGAAQLGPDMESDPDVAVELLTVMGRSYTALEQRDAARHMLERASSIAPRADIARRANLADAFMGLDLEEGDMARARMHGEQLQRLLPHVDDARSRVAYLLSLGDLDVYEGRMDAATRRNQSAVRLARQELPADDIALINALGTQARVMQLDGNFKRSLAPLQEALAHALRSLPQIHPSRLELEISLVQVYKNDRRFGDALALQNKIVHDTRALYGPRSISAAHELASLCKDYMVSGDYSGARPHCAEALSIHREIPGDDMGLSASEFAMASLANAAGKTDEAVNWQTQAITHLEAATGANEPSVAFMRLKLVRLLIAGQRTLEARRLLDKVLAAARPDGSERAISWVYQGVLERQAGHPTDAKRLHEQAIAFLAPSKTKFYNYSLGARLELSRDQHALGDDVASIATLQAIVDRLATDPPYVVPELADAWCELGQRQAQVPVQRELSQFNLHQCVAFRDRVFGKADAQTAVYRTLLTATALDNTTSTPDSDAHIQAQH